MAAGGGGGGAVEQGESLLLRREKGRNAHEKAVELIGELGTTATHAFTTKITERGGGHGLQLEITGSPNTIGTARRIAADKGWRIPGRVQVSDVVMVQPIPCRNAVGFNAALPTTRVNWARPQRPHSANTNRNTKRRSRVPSVGAITQIASRVGITESNIARAIGTAIEGEKSGRAPTPEETVMWKQIRKTMRNIKSGK